MTRPPRTGRADPGTGAMHPERWPHVPTYLGESSVGRAAYRCERCGAHWYPEMGERPPTLCHPTPDWLRRHAAPM